MIRPALRGSAVPLLAVALVSCAPRPAGVELDTDRVSAGELVRSVQAEGARVTTMAGEGTVFFDGPEGGGAAEFLVSLKKPDSLLVELEGPFGLDLGFFFVGGGRFMLFNAMENRLIEGAADASSMKSLLPVELSLEQLFEAFSGRFAIREPGSPLRYAVEEDAFVLALQCGTDTCHYRIDPEALMVTGYRRVARGGAVIVDAEASGLSTSEGISYARRILVRVPARRTTLRVIYRTATVNIPNPSFTYSVPSGVRRSVRN